MAAPKNERLSYTVDESQEVTGLTRSRIYAAIADGTLRTFKAGRRRMISATALKAFIDALEREANGRAAA